MRPLALLKKWKATEFRQFLLYTGYCSIQNIVSSDVLINFLSFMCSVRMFCDKNQNDISYAHSLMEYFVKTFKILYKQDNMSHNIHGLLHIVDDVKEHGTLDSFSAFKFESYLFHLKKMIRKTSQPLQQIHNRLMEHGTPIIDTQIKETDSISETSQHTKGPLIPSLSCCKQYSRAVIKGFVVNTISKGNKCFLFDNGSIGIVCNVCVDFQGTMKLLVQYFQVQANLFTSPCESKEVGVHSLGLLSSHLHVLHRENVSRKVFLFPDTLTEQFFVGVELLHI